MLFSDVSKQWWSLLAVVLTWAAGSGVAQVDLLGQDSASTDQGAVQIDPIQIDLESFGIGGAVRPGAWCGVRLTLTEQTNERREVIVRMGFQDADGDTTQYRTVVSTNPGVRQPVTLYVRIPTGYVGDPPPVVGVYEALEGGEGSGALGYREGALISQARLPGSPVTNAVLTVGQGAMLVIGNRTMGLEAYGDGVGNEAYLAFGHEQSRVLRGILPADLPDRWYGLSVFSEVIWSEGSPIDLGIEQARALREWVQRGGHLVIVLPVVGNDWLALENQELSSMLPRVAIERREAQPVEPYMPMLAVTPDVVLRRPITVHALDPLAEAQPREAMTILAGPDGRPVVSRRLIGLGAVTLVGLDLPSLAVRRGQPGAVNFVPQTSVSPGTPEADVFWHRVLGRRGAMMSEAGVQRWNAQPSTPQVSSRNPTWVDSDFGSEINLTGQAATGVLLGIAVFALYWIVAGPGGFFGLKKWSLTRHAWMAFVVAAAVFTGLAWGGAWAIKPKSLTFDHLTFLDHVYGERVQRTRTIASMMIPAYGDATIEVGTDAELAAGGRGRFTHLAAPWEASDGMRRGSSVGFPDSRGYAIDSRAPSKLTFPARSTVKQVELEWLGGMDWQGLYPVALEGEEFGEIRRAADQRSSTLEGTIAHDLPGELTNVRVFVIERQADLRVTSRRGLNFDDPIGGLLTVGSAYLLEGSWKAGEVRNLTTLTSRASPVSVQSRPTLELFMETLLPRQRMPSFAEIEARPTSGSIENRLIAMSFFNQLAPPRFSVNANVAPTLVRRVNSQTLDLSRWFTQPCVVVIGILELEGEGTCPTPFRVRINDQIREPEIRGRTVVRWIYPLAELPPAFASTGDGEAGPGADGP